MVDTVDVLVLIQWDVCHYVHRTVFSVYPVQEKYEQLYLHFVVVSAPVLRGNVSKVSLHFLGISLFVENTKTSLSIYMRHIAYQLLG